mmetsp:Transcript_39431/g.50910  ORF Transcript_39431/g.50910 Transcript_39431/m.50910 type:complete len:388 (+) Transcript_39431:81-1244(+)
MFKLLIAFAFLVGVVKSSCPNLCSGHGACSQDDMCICYNNWVNGDEDGGDCSQRKCPYERAWVDSPSESNVAHALAECAGRGLCNRETGECECFEGYTGQGCQRTTCPNDCSGHGTCEYIKELRTDEGDDFKWTGDLATSDQFEHDLDYFWDMDKTRGCQCDARWTDYDCSRRMCPRSNYALYLNMDTVPEVQKIHISNASHAFGDFALLFRSRLGEEFTTVKLDAFWLANHTTIDQDTQWGNSTETTVQDALAQLPNFVLENVEVQFNMSVGQNPVGLGHSGGQTTIDYLDIYVTFLGDQTTGDQYTIECLHTYCGDGCFPVLSKPLAATIDGGLGDGTCTVTTIQEATSSNIECSGRGKCNYESGICECFEGYTDEACGTQTALI